MAVVEIIDPDFLRSSLTNLVRLRTVSVDNMSVSPPAGQSAEAVSKLIRVAPGETVRWSFYYSSDSNITSLSAHIAWYAKDGSYIGEVRFPLPVNTSGRTTASAVVPDGVVYTALHLNAYSSSTAAGTATFKDITLSKSSDFTEELIDVALSTRASEATLSKIANALASIATDKLRVSPVDPFPLSPVNISQISGVALTGRDWSSDLAKLQNLDITLTTLSALIRWGRNVSPAWVHAAEVTAPAAGATLVSKTVSTGKSGYIYGFLITASEPNHFKINWTSGATAYSIRIVLSNAGSVESVDVVPLNEGLPAGAGSTVSITVVNAGSTGSVYQARILYAEV